MKLQQYLDDNILEIKEFAARVPVTEHTVYNWLYNGVTPLRIYQLLIQKASDGQVTQKDWEKKNDKKKANRRVRGAEDNGVRATKHLDANKAFKLKSSKKKR